MPLAIPTIAFMVFTALLLFGKIGETTYCFLVASSALLGLVLHGFGRLQELDLKNLRLVLREIEQTKKELFVREEKLKAIAVPLAQIVAFTGASEGRFGDLESVGLKREWYKRKVGELATALELPANETAEIQKYNEKYAEIDASMDGRGALNVSDPGYQEIKANHERLVTELLAMMKLDLTK